MVLRGSEHHGQALGRAGWLGLAFDLDGMAVGQENPSGRLFLNPGEGHPGPDFRIHGHRVEEPDFIQAIVDAHLHFRLVERQLDAVAHRRNQG